MHKFLRFIGLLICYAILSIYSGFVFSNLWGWFVVPLGLPALSIPHAIGVMGVASYPLMGIVMKLETMDESPFTLEHYLENVIRMAIVFSLIWGYAAIVHSFM